MFYLTSTDAKRYVVRHGGWILRIGLFIRNILQTSRLPVQMVLVTLTFVILVVTKSRHEVLKSPCEVS